MSTLEYWDGAAWQTETGLVRTTVEEKLFYPKQATFVVSNAGNSAEANYQDFTRVRWTDGQMGRIMFNGKVIRQKPEFQNSYGSTLTVVAMDNLYELHTQQNNSTYDNNETTRSARIKTIIDEYTYTDGSIINIGTADATKFETSAASVGTEDLNNDYSLLTKNVLRSIYELAENDPWHATSNEGHGYAFYLDEEFSGTTPTPDFHYFKRGSRPAGGPTSHGLTIDYDSVNGTTQTDSLKAMLADFDFPINPQELVTTVRAVYIDNAGATQEVDNLYLINHGAYTVGGPFTTADTISWTGGTAQCEYVSNNAGDSYIIVSNPTAAVIRDLPGATLTGSSSAAQAVVNASTASPPGVLRESIQAEIEYTLRGYHIEEKADAIATAAQILFSGGDQIVRGECRIVGYPFTRFTNTSDGTSATVLTATGDAFDSKDVQLGDIVTNLGVAGSKSNVGTITTVAASALTVSAGGMDWEVGDTYQVDVPVRAGHEVRIVNNDASHVDGTDMLVTGFKFEEGPGVYFTDFQLLGNAKSRGIGAPSIPTRKISEAIEQSLWKSPDAAASGPLFQAQIVSLDNVFTVSGDTVSWTGGGALGATFEDGSTQLLDSGSIDTSTGGGSPNLHYIYLTSGSTTISTTTTFGTAVGTGKNIIAIAQESATAGDDAKIVTVNGVFSDSASMFVGTLVANQLSAITADMGLLTAGEIRVGSGTVGVNFTGFRINSTYLAGYNSETLQTYIDASDGKMHAGAGAVVLDASGIEIGGTYAGAGDEEIMFAPTIGGTRTGTIYLADTTEAFTMASYNSKNLSLASASALLLEGTSATLEANSTDITIIASNTGKTIFLDATDIEIYGFGANAGRLVLRDGDEDKYVGLKTATAQTTSYDIQFPIDDPTNSDMVMTYATSGVGTFVGLESIYVGGEVDLGANNLKLDTIEASSGSSVTVTGDVLPNSGTIDLGSSSAHWDKSFIQEYHIKEDTSHAATPAAGHAVLYIYQNVGLQGLWIKFDSGDSINIAQEV